MLTSIIISEKPNSMNPAVIGNILRINHKNIDSNLLSSSSFNVLAVGNTWNYNNSLNINGNTYLWTHMVAVTGIFSVSDWNGTMVQCWNFTATPTSIPSMAYENWVSTYLRSSDGAAIASESYTFDNTTAGMYMETHYYSYFNVPQYTNFPYSEGEIWNQTITTNTTGCFNMRTVTTGTWMNTTWDRSNAAQGTAWFASEVVNTTTVTVPAGTFETWCIKSSTNSTGGKVSFLYTFYSPSVKAVVLTTDPTGDFRSELLSYGDSYTNQTLQPETTTLLLFSSMNRGPENYTEGTLSVTYNISLLQQTLNTASDYILTTETQQAQQDPPQANTLSNYEYDFDVTTFDGMTLNAKLWTLYPNLKEPLVVLVHGLGADCDIWPIKFFDLLSSLLLRGYTVVAYTQRFMYTYEMWVPDFSYLIKDLGDVIRTVLTDDTLSQHVDGNNIALVGHSLGGYVVTLAACADMSYLLGWDIYSKLRVVIEGDGPANLLNAAIRLKVTDGLRYWVDANWYQIQAAPEPIANGKITPLMPLIGYLYWCVDQTSDIFFGPDHVD